MSNRETASGGVGFLGVLTLIFIFLKLTGEITWSWWWVLAPIWIPWAAVGALFLLAFLISLVASTLKAMGEALEK